MRDENAKMTSGVAATTSRAVSGIPLSLTATCEPQDDKILSLHVPEPTKFFKGCSEINVGASFVHLGYRRCPADRGAGDRLESLRLELNRVALAIDHRRDQVVSDHPQVCRHQFVGVHVAPLRPQRAFRG